MGNALGMDVQHPLYERRLCFPQLVSSIQHLVHPTPYHGREPNASNHLGRQLRRRAQHLNQDVGGATTPTGHPIGSITPTPRG
jgi:hypothetical protein